MGILGRFLGKKRDDLGLDNMGPGLGTTPGFNEPLGSPDMGYENPMGIQPSSQPSQQGFSPEALGFERVPSTGPSYGSPGSQTANEINLGKDLEIISAKLDAIKAELDSVSQRLKRLERIAEGETTQYKDKWSY